MKPLRTAQSRTTEEASEKRIASEPSSPSSMADHPILSLQKTIGNRAVQRLISRYSDGSNAAQNDQTDVSSFAIGEIVNSGLNSSSHPLDAETRRFMEARFGYDFSDVRVHTDPAAAESARAIDAHAYTIGQDILFGSGRYSPSSSEGRKLIAHELTHVTQQGTLPQGDGLTISEPSDDSEQEAEYVAARLAEPVLEGSERKFSKRDRASTVADSSNINSVQRQEDDDVPETDTAGIGFGRDPAGPNVGPEGEPSPYGEDPTIGFGREPNPGGMTDEPRIGFGRDPAGPNVGPEGEPSPYGEDPTIGFGREPGPGGLSDEPRIGFGREPGPEPGEPPSLYGEEPTIGFGAESAEAGAAEGVTEGGGALAGLGAEAILPVALAGAAGVGAGIGLGELADSSYTKTGAFGTNADTGQNQSAMDWGANWGTSVDKWLGNSEPSIAGGIAAGAGGIVGGIGGGLYGALNWLGQQNDDNN